jgi:hypothetical protein
MGSTCTCPQSNLNRGDGSWKDIRSVLQTAPSTYWEMMAFPASDCSRLGLRCDPELAGDHAVRLGLMMSRSGYCCPSPECHDKS